MHPLARQALIDFRDQISFINVSDAEEANTGNGHDYYQNSPWASSDVLITSRFETDFTMKRAVSTTSSHSQSQLTMSDDHVHPGATICLTRFRKYADTHEFFAHTAPVRYHERSHASIYYSISYRPVAAGPV